MSHEPHPGFSFSARGGSEEHRESKRKEVPLPRCPLFTAEEVAASGHNLRHKILLRVYGPEWGSAFTRKDFKELGKVNTINNALNRLAAEGLIRRTTRGWYDGLVSPETRRKIWELLTQEKPLPLSERIMARVQAAPPAQSFTWFEFSDLDSQPLIRASLVYLKSRGLLQRIHHGRYVLAQSAKEGEGTPAPALQAAPPSSPEPPQLKPTPLPLERIGFQYQSAPNRILARIAERGEGWTFGVKDFADLSEYPREALERLLQKGLIFRVGRGQFSRTPLRLEKSPSLAELERIVPAMAEYFATHVFPPSRKLGRGPQARALGAIGKRGNVLAVPILEAQRVGCSRRQIVEAVLRAGFTAMQAAAEVFAQEAAPPEKPGDPVD